MSEQVLRSGNAMDRTRTRTIAQVAMLGAVAGVLMNFEFPLPFLAPSFYQLTSRKFRFLWEPLQWDLSPEC